MNQLRRWGAGLASLALILTILIFNSGGPSKPEAAAGSFQEASKSGLLKNPSGSAVNAAAPKSEAGSLTPSASTFPTSGAQPVLSVPAQHVEELNSFRQIKEKVFLTEAEEVERKKMLRDPEFLRQSGQTLITSAWMQDPQYVETQNAALDLLVDALQGGDRQVAMEVIWSVVKDAQVENSGMDPKTREILAGSKAELLYHASALAPAEFENVESQLPGPVSQKIWQNVQKMHSANVMESQQELQALRSSR